MALNKSLKGKPGCILAIHAQRDTVEGILAVCKSNGVEYPVFESGNYPKADSGGGIPFVVVFDHTGKQIAATHSLSDADEAYKKAVLAAPPIYLGETRFDKLKALALQVQSKTTLGKTASDLRKKLDSADEAEKAEAKTLLDAVEGYARTRTGEIQALQQEDPDQALSDLRALAKELAGDTLGSEAAAQADKDAADPALKTLRLGLKDLSAQTKALESLPPCKACKAQKSAKHADLACDACKKANEASLAAARKALGAIAKKYEGTAAGKKAQELAGKL